MIAEPKYSIGLDDKRNIPESRTQKEKTVKWKEYLIISLAQYDK